jgi:hypothetical protein
MTLAGDPPAWLVGLLAMAVLVMLNISGFPSAKAMLDGLRGRRGVGLFGTTLRAHYA